MTKLVPLNEIFSVSYGHKLDLNKLEQTSSSEGIAFVGRSRSNLGVTAYVEKLKNREPLPKGNITIALGGASVLYSFVQEEPFYTAQNVGVLETPDDMTWNEKLYYCLCIKKNANRYHGFGREANRTFREILVPDRNDVPEWAKHSNYSIEFDRKPLSATRSPEINVTEWNSFSLAELFDVKKGKRLTKRNMTEGTTPFVGSSDKNNGRTASIGQTSIHPGNTITICYNGSVGETFYQPEPFWCSDDVNVLYPKFELTPARGLFLATVLKTERYRYNYGRKWHLDRMRETTIKLPAHDDGTLDLDWIDNFMRCQQYVREIGL